MEESMDWISIGRAGYMGALRDKTDAFLTSAYGNSWQLSYVLGETAVSRKEALQHYEDSYYHFLKSDRQILDWIVNNASEVYDNAPSNINSGLDYNIQETSSTHLQDIAVRRALTRISLEGKGVGYDSENLPKIQIFRGDHPVQIRGKDSEGYILNPGKVPFHDQALLLKPLRKGWWNPGSAEDFWQSNKMIQLKGRYYQMLLEDDSLFPPAKSYYVCHKELDVMDLQWCSFQSYEPEVFAEASVGDSRYGVIANFPYTHPYYVSRAEYYKRLASGCKDVDLLLRPDSQLLRKTLHRLGRFAKKLRHIS